MRVTHAQKLAHLLSAEVGTWAVKKEVLSTAWQQGCLQTSLYPKKSWSEGGGLATKLLSFSDVIGCRSEQTDATMLQSRKHAKQLSF